MLFFKEVVLSSGFVEKRLRELLKTYEGPDPKKDPDTLYNLGTPETLYRVRWVSKEEFEFKCFDYLESRNHSGYRLTDVLMVRLSGTPGRPVLKARLQREFFLSVLSSTAIALAVLALKFVWIYWIGQDYPQYLLSHFWFPLVVYSLFFPIFLFGVFTKEKACLTRLRHLMTRDDWDTGSVKEVGRTARTRRGIR